MNKVYENVFIEKYKKSLDVKLQKKAKEVDEYKEKKKYNFFFCTRVSK